MEMGNTSKSINVEKTQQKIVFLTTTVNLKIISLIVIIIIIRALITERTNR